MAICVSRPRRSFAWTAVLALFVDQLTKLLIQGAYMTSPDKTTWPRGIRLVGEFLFITPTHNPDGLFSWNYGPQYMYFVLPLIGSALVTWFALRSRDHWASVAYGMILGGALGNLIDRARLGWVIDFIDFRLPQLRFQWAIFNFADIFIVVGIIVLLAREFFGRRQPVAMDELADGSPDGCSNNEPQRE